MAQQNADAHQGRVPHPFILPGAQHDPFTSSQPKAAKLSSHLPEIPPYSHAAKQTPSLAEPPAMIPSIPHPPRRTTPNPTPPQAHRSHSEHHPQTLNRPQSSGRSQAAKPHIPSAHVPLGAHFQNPLQTPLQNQLLLNAQLSPSQLQAQRQQLITAYMLQSTGGAGLAQPFFFPAGGGPTTHPMPNPQASLEGSPAPKYTQIEAIVAEMRENMLKVLKTANYKRCKSAKNIRQALREVRTLCKDIRNETTEMGKQKVNPRKKAPTPEGEEGPAKKHKGPENKDAKNSEEVPKGNEEVEGLENGLRRDEEGPDENEARRQDDVEPREGGTSGGASGEGAADGARSNPRESDPLVPVDELRRSGESGSGLVEKSEEESGNEEVGDPDLPAGEQNDGGQ